MNEKFIVDRITQLRVERNVSEYELSYALGFSKSYRRLLKAAQGTRLELVIQTICETGIRVSELKYITIEAVEQGRFYSQNRKNVI